MKLCECKNDAAINFWSHFLTFVMFNKRYNVFFNPFFQYSVFISFYWKITMHSLAVFHVRLGCWRVCVDWICVSVRLFSFCRIVWHITCFANFWSIVMQNFDSFPYWIQMTMHSLVRFQVRLECWQVYDDWICVSVMASLLFFNLNDTFGDWQDIPRISDAFHWKNYLHFFINS